MYLGKLEILERPKSKWPYWVLYKFKDPAWSHGEDLNHVYKKIDLLRDKIPVVVERQWGQYTTSSGRKYKIPYGVLYKFLHAEDRLIFLMSQETGQ